MANYINAYDILTEACIKFCEDSGLYSDLVAEIATDVLGHDYVYCICYGDTFEYATDWYEGGNLEIIDINYFSNICDKAFLNIEREKNRRCK
ncbi:MAG: hypothetical protein IIY21_21215 [Clostridiales bacterium]|nr:hypothetical protein [Clostridiales bacterium]MBQ1572932.1 hypothetical protein [Clostridiales bacterium]